jgi:hypothetical protein
MELKGSTLFPTCYVLYTRRVPDYHFRPYFENQVIRKRPYLTKDMCIRIVRSPVRVELQGTIVIVFGAGLTSSTGVSCESSRFPIN